MTLYDPSRHEELRASVERDYIRRASEDLMVFLHGLKIHGARGPAYFSSSVMCDFQRETFEALAPNLRAVQLGDMPDARRFWIERTKKAGKDSDLAACLLWMLAFPRRPLYLQVGAADRDQAGIVRRRMEALLFYNPWLGEMVKINQYRVNSVDGLADLDIIAADASSAHGGTPDILVINELSHVTKWEFIQNLIDNANGVPQGVMIIATNAGILGSKAHSMKAVVESNPIWKCMYWSQPAPWLTTDTVEDARKLWGEGRYRMYWHGEWIAGKGDAFNSDTIAKCFVLDGPKMEPEPGWRHIGGLDLGVSHDHAALVVLAVNTEFQKVRVVWFRRWKPSEKEGEIDLSDVEEHVLGMNRVFHFEWVGYDPYQAALMAQRLRKSNVPMHDMVFSGRNLRDMADSMKMVMESGKLEAYDDSEGSLRRDFGKLTLEAKSYGYRLSAVSDETGHADVATALIIAMPRAVAMMDTSNRLDPDRVVFDTQEASADEIASMPAELRDIYEMGNTDIGDFGFRKSRRMRDDDDD